MADYRDRLDEWREAARRKARELDEKYQIRERVEEGARAAGEAARRSADAVKGGAERARDGAERLGEDFDLDEHAQGVRERAQEAREHATRAAGEAARGAREGGGRAGEGGGEGGGGGGGGVGRRRVEFERKMVRYVGAPLLGTFSCAAGLAMWAQILQPGPIVGAPISWLLGGNPILDGIWLFSNGVICMQQGYKFFMIALRDQEDAQRIVREIRGLLPSTAGA